MTSNLKETESSTLREEVVVRVRGTFIDIATDFSPQRKRSGSAPPRNGACFNEDQGCSGDSRYISDWIGRAMKLSAFRSDRQHNALDDKSTNQKNICLVAEPPNHMEEKDRQVISLSDDRTVPPPMGTGGTAGSPGMPDAHNQQVCDRTQHSMERRAPKCFNVPEIGDGRCLCALVVPTGKCFCTGVKGVSVVEPTMSIVEFSTSTTDGFSIPIAQPLTTKNASCSNWQRNSAYLDSSSALGILHGGADAYYHQMGRRTEYRFKGNFRERLDVPATGKCFSAGVKGLSFEEHATSATQLSTSLMECRGAPIKQPPTSKVASWNDLKEDSRHPNNSRWADATRDPLPTPDPKQRLEDAGPCKRLNLSRNGASKDACQKWPTETILSKNTHQERSAAQEVTTLMICDIPCRQTIEQIIDAINLHGFANTFDLVYMPAKRPKYIQNMGHAFVNFRTAAHASAFGEAFNNFRFASLLSKKVSYTKPAPHQGYTENLNSYIKHRAVGCLVTYDEAQHGRRTDVV